MHSGQVSNGLGHLVKTVVGTGPVQDPHMEQTEENWIVDASPIYHSKPFHPLDHVGPETIIKVKVWVHVPPPPIMDNCLVIWFSCLPNTMEGILGDLQFSVSVSFNRNKEGNYLESQRVMPIA